MNLKIKEVVRGEVYRTAGSEKMREPTPFGGRSGASLGKSVARDVSRIIITGSNGGK